MSAQKTAKMSLQKAPREYELLAANEAAFKERLVESTLQFYNDMHADTGRASIGEGNLGEIVGAAFSWVPPTMKLRANAISPKGVVEWCGTEDSDDVQTAARAMLFLVGAFKDSLRQVGEVGLLDGRRLSSARWLDEVLSDLAIYSRYTFDGKEVSLFTIPCLTRVRSCIAYAIALIKRNEDGLGDRVRSCGYLRQPKPGSLAHHLFLARDGKQKYCCPNHGNAVHQRTHRTGPRRKHK
jgi:hypothetical protein